MRTTAIAFLLCFIAIGDIAMAGEPTLEEQTAELKKQTDSLTQELAKLKDQITRDQAKQDAEAIKAKAYLDSLKDQITSQYNLGVAQAQLPFAELQGINAGVSGIDLPSGKEGTVKISAGTAGTALIRSKKPMIELLDTVANEFVNLCKTKTILVTNDQLMQAYAADFTNKRIKGEIEELKTAVAQAEKCATGTSSFRATTVLPELIAGAYSVGFAVDTINSLIKLLRTNRQLDVFGADEEAFQMLGYLLDSKPNMSVAHPVISGDKVISEADALMKELKSLGVELQKADDVLARMKKKSENAPLPPEQNQAVSLLKNEMDIAKSLFDSIHPNKKPDSFWTQVNGQLLSQDIKDKQRLIVEMKAQSIQVTESRWYTSERILATGEVQVAYRLIKSDGSLQSGIILKGSGTDKNRIDKLEELKCQWPAGNSVACPNLQKGSSK